MTPAPPKPHRYKAPRLPQILTLALAGLVSLVLGTACLGGITSLGTTYQGAVLELTLLEIVNVPEIYTLEDGQPGNYLRPSHEGNDLLLIHAIVHNHAATTVQMNLDPIFTELGTVDGTEHFDYNPLTIPHELPHYYQRADTDLNIPLLRGDHRLDRGFELDGWMVFDVVKGSAPDSFRWSAGGDIIIIDI